MKTVNEIMREVAREEAPKLIEHAMLKLVESTEPGTPERIAAEYASRYVAEHGTTGIKEAMAALADLIRGKKADHEAHATLSAKELAYLTEAAQEAEAQTKRRTAARVASVGRSLERVGPVLVSALLRAL